MRYHRFKRKVVSVSLHSMTGQKAEMPVLPGLFQLPMFERGQREGESGMPEPKKIR
jgi:hypothetical protein